MEEKCGCRRKISFLILLASASSILPKYSVEAQSQPAFPYFHQLFLSQIIWLELPTNREWVQTGPNKATHFSHMTRKIPYPAWNRRTAQPQQCQFLRLINNHANVMQRPPAGQFALSSPISTHQLNPPSGPYNNISSPSRWFKYVQIIYSSNHFYIISKEIPSWRSRNNPYTNPLKITYEHVNQTRVLLAA